MKNNRLANPSLEKRQAHQAAKALLDQQNDAVLRYVALELRRCIESVVYEKLQIYGSMLPEGSVYKWQPAQAFDVLIEIEPDAEETFTVAMAQQEAPDKPATTAIKTIGVDVRPKARWVKKLWNKLGSYLHAEWPFGKSNKPEGLPRDFLDKALADLTPFVSTSFTMTMSNIVDFPCRFCRATVKVMTQAVESTSRAICFGCGMRYRAEKAQSEFIFFPDEPTLTCECGAETPVQSQRTKVGYRFPCLGCERVFEVASVDWHCRIVDGTNPNAVGGRSSLP